MISGHWLDDFARERRHSPPIWEPSWRRERRPGPADWGIGMTLCIAAIAEHRSRTHVIAISDMMLSTEAMSFEPYVPKCGMVTSSGRWIAMYAGDPSAWGAIMSRARPAVTATGEDVWSVQRAFESAFRFEVQRRIEGEVLSSYGLTREQFLKQGREFFGERKFETLATRIERIRLDTEVLIAGFDPGGHPHVISIVDPGVGTSHSALGFRAIGSGYVLATGSLCATYRRDASPVDLSYRLCEAKFLGEAALGVGKHTFLVEIDQAGQHRAIFSEQLAAVRKIWQREGRPKVPRRAAEVIRDRLIAITPPKPKGDSDPTT